MKVIQFIRVNHLFNRVAFASAAMLFLLVSLLFLPISNNELETKATTGTAAESSITMNFTSSTASVDLTVNNTDGTFATSSTEEKAAFSIATNNYTGYTLSISASDDTGTLLNGSNSLDSISSNLTEAEFNTPTNNGKWGYKPNKFYASNEVVDNTGDNAVFLSSPTTEATTLDVTNAANNEANSYTIGLGARTDYSSSAGTYAKTFTLTAVGNPVNYSVTYNKNTADTVTNMPYESTNNMQTGDTSGTTIILSDLVPVREGYTFKGWCSTTTSDATCSGITYNPNGGGTNLTYGIDQTALNSASIYAMWQINALTCTKQYRLQNADGTYPSEYIEDGSEEVNPGETCTYSKTITDYQGDNGNDTERSVSQILGENIILRLDFPRNTYSLTVEKDDTRFDSIAGAGVYRWGQVVSISAVASTDYTFYAWSQTSGVSGSFESNKTASTTFEMSNGDATIYAKALPVYLQDMIADDCVSAYYFKDRRNNQFYNVDYASAYEKCVMRFPLNLGGSAPIVLTSEDTNLAEGTTYTLPASSETINDDDTFLYTAGNGEYISLMGTAAYYSHNVATAGDNAPGTNKDASYDICPRGWRLPTRSEIRKKNAVLFSYSSHYGYYSTSYNSFVPTTLAPRTHTFVSDDGYLVWTGTSYYSSYDSAPRVRAYTYQTNSKVTFEASNYFNAYPMRCILK